MASSFKLGSTTCRSDHNVALTKAAFQGNVTDHDQLEKLLTTSSPSEKNANEMAIGRWWILNGIGSRTCKVDTVNILAVSLTQSTIATCAEEKRPTIPQADAQ